MRWTGTKALVVLLAAAVALKTAILLTSQRWADADESVIGVMALHILHHGAHPIYFWGQNYGGGGAIEAYLAAPLFGIFGASSIVLKLVPALLYLGTATLLYLLMKPLYGEIAGLGCAALFAFGSPLTQWFSKARGGYAETLFLTVLILFIVARLSAPGRRPLWLSLALGGAMGFGYYNQELIAPLLLAVGIYLLFLLEPRITVKMIGAMGLGLLIGILPCIIYNLNNGGGNFKFILDSLRSTVGGKGPTAGKVWTTLFPALFQGNNIDQYPSSLPVSAYIEAMLYGVLAIYACGTALGKRVRAGGRIDLLLAIHLVVSIALISLSPRTDWSPRYFLPLFPTLVLLTVIGLSQLSAPAIQVEATSFNLAALVCGALIALGVGTNLSYIRAATATDVVWIPNGSIFDVEVAGDSVAKIIDLLNKQNVRFVKAPYFLQWRLIFESDEKIIASSDGLHPDGHRYDQYDRQVAAESRVALVYHHASGLNDSYLGRPWSSHIQESEYEVFLP